MQVGGCTGVCVDPEGLVLTAKHCDLREVEHVQFGTVEVLAIRIYETELTEGPVVYDCVGSGYQCVPVAQNPPDAGERVSTMGFPLVEVGRMFREERGTVLCSSNPAPRTCRCTFSPRGSFSPVTWVNRTCCSVSVGLDLNPARRSLEMRQARCID